MSEAIDYKVMPPVPVHYDPAQARVAANAYAALDAAYAKIIGPYEVAK
jgi:hypothetical protein